MTDPGAPLSYPRQEAVTRRFRLGVPRSFSIAPDGGQVAFVRSASGRDPVGSLWVAEPDGNGGLKERLVVDARELARPGGDLPEAEKARRERMRETTSGITAYSADDAVTRVAFALDGVPYAAELAPGATPIELPHPGPVVDPRLSPDGATVAFVSDRALHIVAADGASPATVLCEPQSATQSWGLADFVAAEELDRVRGLWWLSTSDALLAEFVDEADVAVRWIGDPAHPDREPTAHRYPAAGTDNATARLFRIALDGAREEIAWDHAAYPYLATVQPDAAGGAVISVLSRDQQRQVILDVTASGTVTVLRDRVTSPWTTMVPGVPCRSWDGVLLEVVADTDADCFRLVADGQPITPPNLNVTGVLDASAAGTTITAQPGPLDQHVLRVDPDGTVAAIADGDTYASAVAGPGGVVVATTSPATPGSAIRAVLAGAAGPIANLAEFPVVRPRVAFHRVSERDLACAVLWPTGHELGSAPLPVVLTPYGGPHHARVVHAAGAFAADQWLADQGFAVVVVDGAGTPGRGPAWEFEISGDLATRVLDDQVTALHALAGVYADLDLTRVGITGWSFGGYLAALALMDRPDVFRVAVAGAPVADWSLYDTAYTERYLGRPQDNEAGYAAASLLGRAARLERPLLIIHGLADDNVLVANSLQLSGALLAAGRPHSVLPLSGVTHMTPQEVVAENLLRLEVDFLATHLR